MSRRWTWPAGAIAASMLLLVWALAQIYWPGGHGLDITQVQIGRDFINVWVGPKLATQGQISSLSDYQKYSDLAARLFGQPIPMVNWSYPPTTLLLYYPFSLASYFQGLALWTILGIALALTVFRAYCKDHPWAVLGFLLSPAVLINILSGQNGFFTAFLLLGGFLALRRYPILAGIAFGLLTFKPHLGIILPFVLITLKAWRTILSAIISATVFIGVSIAVFGIGIWRDYFFNTVEIQMSFLYSFRGMYSIMMQSPYILFRLVRLGYETSFSLQMILAVFVIIHTIMILRRMRDTRQQAFVVVSAVPLVTPYIFNYDMVALSVMLTCLLWSNGVTKRWHRWVYLLAWLSPLLTMFIGASDLPWLRLIAPVAYIGVFLLACHGKKNGNEADLGLESHNLA